MNQTKAVTRNWKRYAIIAAVISSLILAFLAFKTFKKGPNKNATIEQAIKVRSMVIPGIDVIPRLIGYGRVIPRKTWECVAQISGQVVWTSDDLQDGKVISEGTELLHIDDANYRLSFLQAEAALKASVVKYKTAQDSLLISEKNLAILQTEYKRNQKLTANGTISKAALDASKRQVLAGQTQAENLQNTLDLINAEHQTVIAQKEATSLDLERTIVAAPFDVRITKVGINQSQYASKGQQMFIADGLDVAEIEAQFSVGILRPLIKGLKKNEHTIVNVTQLNALVRLRTATHTVEWSARVDRISGSIDPLTQNLGVIVAVDNPYAMATPGERPPLLRDTFVEVELSSKPIPNQNVIPWNAIHDNKVYIVNKDSRLEVRKVEIDFVQQNYAVIANGVTTGERIVLSDLTIASPGMLLAPEEDAHVLQDVMNKATGKSAQK